VGHHQRSQAFGVEELEQDVLQLETGQRIEPAVTFGQGPFAAIKHRLDDVLDALKGPIGIAVVVVLLVLFLWPRFKLARRRASYKDKY